MEQVKEDLRQIRSSQQRTEIDIAEIKKDLGHHMARTEASESRILYLERIYMGLAAVAVLGGVIKLLIG